jgi:hypothetical protein
VTCRLCGPVSVVARGCVAQQEVQYLRIVTKKIAALSPDLVITTKAASQMARVRRVHIHLISHVSCRH